MTYYRLAVNSSDYKKAHKLIRDEGAEDNKLNAPTLLAFDSENNELIGLLGTNLDQKMIIAGPLVMRSDKRRIFSMMRLIENYERVMKACGVTQYIFSIGMDQEDWARQIKEIFQIDPYATQNGRAFYARNL